MLYSYGNNGYGNMVKHWTQNNGSKGQSQNSWQKKQAQSAPGNGTRVPRVLVIIGN